MKNTRKRNTKVDIVKPELPEAVTEIFKINEAEIPETVTVKRGASMADGKRKKSHSKKCCAKKQYSKKCCGKKHRRKQKSAAKCGRLLAALLSIGLVTATIGYGILQRTKPLTAMAKESFAGIGKIVEEHDEDNPYKILDIVPSKAYCDVDIIDETDTVVGSKRYTFSTGTMGYLTGGQTALGQDLKNVFENSQAYLRYSYRLNLYNHVVLQSASESFPGIQYEEAYGGIHKNLSAAEGWTLLFESQETDPSAGNSTAGMSEGILQGSYQKKADGDDDTGYDFIALSGINGHNLSGEGMFQSNPDAGNWHIIFSAMSDTSESDLNDLYVVDRADQYDLGSYSETTGLYLREEDGRYCYVGTVGQIVYGKNYDYSGSNHGGESSNGNENGSSIDSSDGNENAAGDAGSSEIENQTDGAGIGGEDTDETSSAGTVTGESGETDGTGNDEGDAGETDGIGNDEGDAGETGSTGTIEDNAGENGDTGTDGEDTDSSESDTGNSGGIEDISGGEVSTQWRKLVEDNAQSKTDDSASGGSSVDESKTGSSASGGGVDESKTGGSASGGSVDESKTGGSVSGGVVDESKTDGSASGGNHDDDSNVYNLPESSSNGSNDDNDSTEIVIDLSAQQYYVVTFKTAEEISDSGVIYYVADKEEEIYSGSDEPRPYDAYDRLSREEEDTDNISAFSYSDAVSPDAVFLYVGAGNGDYKLTESKESTALTLEVYNVPLYFRCCSNNNWLEQYVFISLAGGDNERSSFTIEVENVRADEVTADMIQEADLVYLESGFNPVLNPTLYTEYIQASDDDWMDMGEDIVGEIIRRVSDDLMPIIVDYDIVEDKEHYSDTNYQYLAKALLKQDLSSFYAEMNIKGNLMDNLKMNVDKDDDFPDKDDNSYNYVNKNVYIVNDDTPLVSEDFHDAFDDDKTDRGFADIVAAIKAENTTLEEKDRLLIYVSKARAVQYIINYSGGIIGEFGDLNILELQPTANKTSDLHIVKDDKGNTKLCWQTESMQSAKQILFSKKSFDVSTNVKSVAQFNGEWEDINSTYDLVFIGLDGQRLNQGNDRYRSPVYNNKDLAGKVYHTGDDSGVGTYDSNDITAQKMMELLEYMEAGYPVLVENNCFKKGSARNTSEEDINTKYIDEDSVMYHFLNSAVTDERYQERIFTVSDAMSSAMFITQLKISKPRVELQAEDGVEPAKVQLLASDENDEYHGRIAYEIKDNRDGEYFGETEIHLYVDLNYDGIFGAEEELSEYSNESDVIDVAISGMGPGILPWKLEVTDRGNSYRRDSVQGYFELISSYQQEIRILQISDVTDNVWMNLQEMYDEMENSVLAYYIQGAERITNMSMQFETVTSGELASRLAENEKYLNQWDVVVLTLDNSVSSDTVTSAVEKFVNDGRSLLVCSHSAGGNRMGLSAELLGQAQENRTYVSLGADGAGGYYRYAGLTREMFEPQTNLLSEQLNDGSIAYYPYQLEGNNFTLGNRATLRASDFLLDFENNLKSETGEAYVTAWYTLGGSAENTAYGISPKDARNNYYCYSRGNVVYLGQAEYPYTYDAEASEKPDGKEGTEECKFFINALMAAYSAGVHRSDVAIVAGFAEDSAQIQSISVPFDQEWRDASDHTEGILDNTVDVYFRFTDSNIAMDKEMQISFYYENPEGDVSLEDIGESVKATAFQSEIWTVTDNRLTLVGEEGLQIGKVYRIQAPVMALKTNDAVNNANIYIVLQSNFRRGNKTYEVLSGDAVSLNRAQLFLLE